MKLLLSYPGLFCAWFFFHERWSPWNANGNRSHNDALWIPTTQAFALWKPHQSRWSLESLSETRQDTFGNVDGISDFPRQDTAKSTYNRSSRGKKGASRRSSSFPDAPLPQSSVTLSPLQVLYEVTYENSFVDVEERCQQSTYLQRPVSLRRGLQRMREALASWSTTMTTATRQEHQQQVPEWIRLEQRIHTGTTDPLAWLDGQTSRQYDDVIAQAPLFYFANQEGTTEVAVLGSVYTATETAQVWKLMPDLPQNSKWYGGEPFDRSSPRRGPWQAWNGTSAWWILPAVEIRRHASDDTTATTLAVHVHSDALEYVKNLLDHVTEKQSEQCAPTTLPPILSRDGSLPQSFRDDLQDGQDLYEQAVQAALPRLTHDLQKVVLARPQQLHFGVQLAAGSMLRRWKYGGHEGGHLFWMRPAAIEDDNNDEVSMPDFVGCTPERLFRIEDQTVSTEALAGTRPRGSTAAADAQLCQDLFDSPKDMAENRLTGDFIVDTLQKMETKEWVRLAHGTQPGGNSSVFVRRLRHLQHICHSYLADIVDQSLVRNVTEFLLEEMHPTPAVCGVPAGGSRRFIREYESIGFDRGFYSGPVGYLGQQQSDLVVGIRSGVVQQRKKDHSIEVQSTLTLYAGAGIVPGSTLQGEWSETNYKLAVVASLFPQSPFSLQGALTPNSAWAAAFIEELIRSGITQFYICPGSRSTPLVVAISKALRAHLGIVHADSVHDERAAAFRALGYARVAGKPAAVVTSSGTAVANLYPAVVEASMDGVPMLLLTADRPYESRSTGANQAIDQVGIFSSSYVRWFRDIPPPSDEVPISLVLSDVDHAVDVAKRARGPVHLNIQFRENLAPDSGKIRNDDRVDAITKFDAFHFTSTPKFYRWSMSGKQFSKLLALTSVPDQNALRDIARLIESSERGIIVVGNVRPSVSTENDASVLSLMDTIADFAEHIGFPIFAGVQSAALRFRSAAVVPFAEHLLRSPLVRDNLKPDLVIQIGAPLVSTEISNVIRTAVSNFEEMRYILVHPHSPGERFDPDFTVTHRVSSEIEPCLSMLMGIIRDPVTSELATLIPLGRRLGSEMRDIILESTSAVSSHGEISLSEPAIILSVAQSIQGSDKHALFLSNSMPIRDAEAFLYPFDDVEAVDKPVDLCVVGSSRGASGIDGIIATAKGLSECAKCTTTLLIGDVAALHDVSSLHALANDDASHKKNPGRAVAPLTTIVVNNDGGGIFSFLPIAAHGSEVSFNEFFGTPTSSFDFQKGSEAFGVPCAVANDPEFFNDCYQDSLSSEGHTMIEGRVLDRDTNVRIHREISSRTNNMLENVLKPVQHAQSENSKLHSRIYLSDGDVKSTIQRTLLLLHGWMGDGLEWNETATILSQKLKDDWHVIALDLPGHGLSPGVELSDIQRIRKSLLFESDFPFGDPSIESLARSVLSTLHLSTDVKSIDAIAGYSLGGRVALAMKDLWASGEFQDVLNNNTKMVLIGSAPRSSSSPDDELSEAEVRRLKQDFRLSTTILRLSNLAIVRNIPVDSSYILWHNIVDKWYNATIWGDLQNTRRYGPLRKRRSRALHTRAADLASVLKGCSPPKDRPSTTSDIVGMDTLFISGERDHKYSDIGYSLAKSQNMQVKQVANCGHALLTESPEQVANNIVEFLMSENGTIPRLRDEKINAFLSNSKARTDAIDLAEAQSNEKESLLQAMPFSIDLINHATSSRVQSGIGWGEQASARNALGTRSGFLIEIKSPDGSGIALGEASPLDGVHPETLHNATESFDRIKAGVESKALNFSAINFSRLLQLDGHFFECMEMIKDFAGDVDESRSIFTAVEMALLGLASQEAGVPILNALARGRVIPFSDLQTSINLNGLMLRNSEEESAKSRLASAIAFSSIKVKVGHQNGKKDLRVVSNAFERADLQRGRGGANIRLDANRAWNETEAMSFVASLEGIDARSFDRIEFIEEPLKKTSSDFASHVEDLERFYRRAGMKFALDESLADLARDCDYNYMEMELILLRTFKSARGCAAFVLKPTLLGLELSMQLATLARKELGIGAVFTSCFESGVALAYTAFLAALSDSIESDTPIYAHGLGTFEMLGRDTLSPSFASHVDGFGRLNVASLSRSLYGLSLSELRQAVPPAVPVRPTSYPKKQEVDRRSSYDASAVQSDSEISFAVFLDLPFSSDVAHARFTDLPQQPRWSPWLASVAYQGTQETEWKLNIRGIPLQWRAQSVILQDPFPAIEWKSVSGLSNHGIVEFVPTGANSCEMKVRLVTRPPRILRPLFRGASIFLEDFIRDKLLKWSLEMFRDVVKADLALERGDVELGDALFGAVAGKVVAIEAALKSKPASRRLPPDNTVEE